MTPKNLTRNIFLGALIAAIYTAIYLSNSESPFTCALILTTAIIVTVFFIKVLWPLIVRNKMNVLKGLKLILTILWVLLFVYEGFISYDVHGDDAFGSAMRHTIYTFPICIPFIFILKVFNFQHVSAPSAALIGGIA
jgi:hypothetical protein